jgi:hypothetical protein
MADAPVDQYAPFVRTTPEIQDRKTSLYWFRAPVGKATFAGAAATCPTQVGGIPVAYQIPTVKELLTLVDEEPHDEYEDGKLVAKVIDGNAFPGTPADWFWSSSRNADNPSEAWAVSFATGEARKFATTASHWVRCVR